MQTVNGNSADKATFSNIINEHIAGFKKAMSSRYLVGKNAFYTPNALKAMP